jgi:integrase
MSAHTSNYYLKSIKQFCKWTVQDGRAGTSPLEHLRTINAQTDKRRERRALETDEIRHLLETTAVAPERFGMTGHQRALLYRLAAESGLRASELRSLAVSSFDFDRCTVKVQASYSKHRRQDELPLRPDMAAELIESIRSEDA